MFQPIPAERGPVWYIIDSQTCCLELSDYVCVKDKYSHSQKQKEWFKNTFTIVKYQITGSSNNVLRRQSKLPKSHLIIMYLSLCTTTNVNQFRPQKIQVQVQMQMQ